MSIFRLSINPFTFFSLGFLLVFTSKLPAASPITYDWMTDASGWLRSTNQGTFSHHASDGNPDGFIRHSYNGTFDNVGISNSAAAELKGDYGSGGIQSISVDVRKGAGESIETIRYRLRGVTGGNGWEYIASGDLVSDTWSTFAAPFDASWTDAQAVSNGWSPMLNTQASFATIATNVAQIYAQGYRGPSTQLTMDFDNFAISTSTVIGSHVGDTTANVPVLHNEPFEPPINSVSSGSTIFYNGWGNSTPEASISHVIFDGNPDGYLNVLTVGTVAKVGLVFGPSTTTLDSRAVGNYARAGVNSMSIDVRNLGEALNETGGLQFELAGTNGARWAKQLSGSLATSAWSTVEVDFDPLWEDAEAEAAGWVRTLGTASFAATLSGVTHVRIEGIGIADSYRSLDFDNFVLDGMANTGLMADFDGDHDVDGSDFLIWQAGFGSSRSENDLADWKAEYGMSSGTGSLFSAGNNIPEPSTFFLGLLSVLIFCISASARSRAAI